MERNFGLPHLKDKSIQSRMGCRYRMRVCTLRRFCWNANVKKSGGRWMKFFDVV